MLAVFPLDEAYLIGGWLEGCLWGFSTLLISISLYTTFTRKERISKFTTASLIVLYLLATIHMVLALVRLINGFIRYRDTIGPVAYLANIALPLNVAKDWIYITNLFVGDLVIVWRLHVIWGKNAWVTAFPLVMVLGELVAGYGALAEWFLPRPVLATTANWGTAMFIISMATNLLATGAIAGRIWYIAIRPFNKTLHCERSARYSRLVLLLVESGALITAAKLVEFVLFKLDAGEGRPGLNALYIVYEAMPQITVITPTLIIYAVNAGYTQESEYAASRDGSTLVFAKHSASGGVSVENTLVSAPLSTSTPLSRHDKSL